MEKEEKVKNIYDFADMFKKNKRLVEVSIITIIMNLAAHCYAYTNTAFLHDRQNYFSNIDFRSAINTRWFSSFVNLLTSSAYVPWLYGVLLTIFFIISVYIIVSLLEVKRILSIILIAGLCTSHYTVICCHFFGTYDFFAALVFACLAAWIWNKDNVKLPVRLIFASGFIALSAASYGAYLGVFPVLVIYVSILKALDGENTKKVFLRSIESIAELIMGIVIYYVIERALLHIFNVQLIDYMGESKIASKIGIVDITNGIGLAYKNTFRYYAGLIDRTIPRGLAIGALVLSIILFILLLIRNRKKQTSVSLLLLVFYLAVLPLALGLIYVLAFGNVHKLMQYTFVLYYVFMVKMAELLILDSGDAQKKAKSYVIQFVSIASLLIIIGYSYEGILNANLAYIRAEELSVHSYTLAIRAIDKIESTPGYTGNEDIICMGDLADASRYNPEENLNSLGVFDDIEYISKDHPDGFDYYGSEYRFMGSVVNFTPNWAHFSKDFCTDEEYDELKQLPVFPAEGCTKKIENRIFIRFTEDF